ncbi:MAG TPA: response regulator [Caldimonas sp.]|jgi:two-component system CheB/CheR fusion protein|nr:response regulator [Caldimonas sp.]HEX2540412.1 response regulator [Caldimonas sp.]
MNEHPVATPLPRTAGSRAALRIFIVENHEDTRFLLGLLLEQLGHSVLSVATMQEALRTIPDAHCDVLISDVGLPDGNGWELLKKLGSERPRYAVAMSGFGMSADRERSRAAGYRHHLLKPIEPNQLETLLDEAAREIAADA